MDRNLAHLSRLQELVTTHRKRRFANYRELLKSGRTTI